MTESLTVEDAYARLSNYVMDFIGPRAWTSAGCTAEMTPSTVTFRDVWLAHEGTVDEKALGWSDRAVSRAAMAAASFLRVEMERIQGAAPWSLTFTLSSNGKFNLKYGYDKPDWYDQNDTISASDAFQSLSNLGVQMDPGDKSAK